MNNESHIQELDRSIAENNKLVELAKSLERLENNRDFRRIIGEGYFNQEAVRLVHLKADQAMQSPASQAAILRDIDAIGTLAGYFRSVRIQAGMAAASIDAAEEQRIELLNGED